MRVQPIQKWPDSFDQDCCIYLMSIASLNKLILNNYNKQNPITLCFSPGERIVKLKLQKLHLCVYQLNMVVGNTNEQQWTN